MSKPKPLHVYIAGPMSGHADYNYPAFHAAAARLEAAGYRVTNPATLHKGEPGSKPYREYLAADIRALTRCNAIALLDGWRDSEGAHCEAEVSRAMRMVRICPYSARVLPQGLQWRVAA